MCKDFKKRIAEQKKADNERRWKSMHKNFEINDKQVEVDCSNYYIKDEEIKMVITDILDVTHGQTITKGKVWELSRICDVDYDISFLGCKDDKLYFNIIMQIQGDGE